MAMVEAALRLGLNGVGTWGWIETISSLTGRAG